MTTSFHWCQEDVSRAKQHVWGRWVLSTNAAKTLRKKKKENNVCLWAINVLHLLPSIHDVHHAFRWAVTESKMRLFAVTRGNFEQLNSVVHFPFWLCLESSSFRIAFRSAFSLFCWCQVEKASVMHCTPTVHSTQNHQTGLIHYTPMCVHHIKNHVTSAPSYFFTA